MHLPECMCANVMILRWLSAHTSSLGLILHNQLCICLEKLDSTWLSGQVFLAFTNL